MGTNHAVLRRLTKNGIFGYNVCIVNDKELKMPNPKFPEFDINAACEHFDYENKRNWKRIDKFIIAASDETADALANDGFYDITEDECEAFDAGIQHALKGVNKALKAAGVAVEIRRCDLVDNLGYVLVNKGDTPESWVKRVLK